MASTSIETSTLNGVQTKSILAPRPNLAGLVLAAGKASRFGSDKRQAPYGNKHTLLSRSVESIKAYCSHVFVITRPGDEEQKNLLGEFYDDDCVEQYIANDSLHGMGASLANGVDRVLSFEGEHQQFDGLLVMLADMPYIKDATIARLVTDFQPDKITVPCYLECHKEKKWGNPVLFSRKWFSALQGLHGDRGAKSLIKANPCARVEVVVDDPGILRDVDKPEDLR